MHTHTYMQHSFRQKTNSLVVREAVPRLVVGLCAVVSCTSDEIDTLPSVFLAEENIDTSKCLLNRINNKKRKQQKYLKYVSISSQVHMLLHI